jgi:hypothetical protein
MKKLLASLILAAAVATPAMAQTYMQSMTSPHRTVQAQPDIGYDAYAYAPPGWDTTKINSPIYAMDPDPSVRHQLQIQSDLSNR